MVHSHREDSTVQGILRLKRSFKYTSRLLLTLQHHMVLLSQVANVLNQQQVILQFDRQYITTWEEANLVNYSLRDHADAALLWRLSEVDGASN
ncbi:hypothetical protein J6590_021684 [Homalodisca vitripennis]|nr:hypothetical protein J6590_021684 [Homalodisca vitripennis]